MAIFRIDPILAREQKSDTYRTADLRAGQVLQDKDQPHTLAARQCAEIHMLEQLLKTKRNGDWAGWPQALTSMRPVPTSLVVALLSPRESSSTHSSCLSNNPLNLFTLSFICNGGPTGFVWIKANSHFCPNPQLEARLGNASSGIVTSVYAPSSTNGLVDDKGV